MTFLQKNGLVIRDGRLCGDRENSDAARKFVARLLRMAEEAEKEAQAVTPYKARILRQNAGAARREAARILKTLQE